jgi:ketosteroid isomerase-like protein
MSGPPRNGRPAAPKAQAEAMTATRIERVREFFESITPGSAARIDAIYADDAWFKDPFNEVRGAAAISRIFTHMFAQVQSPRFVVREVVAQGDEAFLTWDFLFRAPRLGGGEQCIHGASHLKFDAAGRIAYHRDYWDAAEELYEKLPGLGALMRWLKRRAAA